MQLPPVENERKQLGACVYRVSIYFILSHRASCDKQNYFLIYIRLYYHLVLYYVERYKESSIIYNTFLLHIQLVFILFDGSVCRMSYIQNIFFASKHMNLF